jgi:hypothetical protein
VALWLCPQCKNEWEARVNNRNRGEGCSCTANQRFAVNVRKNKIKSVGSLAVRNPTLAKEWHPTKNAPLTPQDLTSGVNQSVWWLCSKCEHEWEAKINNRNHGNGCPDCNKRKKRKLFYDSLVEINPYIANEWHPIRNGGLIPDKAFYGSHRKIWRLCSICKHEWIARISDRSKNDSGCPVCKKDT